MPVLLAEAFACEVAIINALLLIDIEDFVMLMSSGVHLTGEPPSTSVAALAVPSFASSARSVALTLSSFFSDDSSTAAAAFPYLRLPPFFCAGSALAFALGFDFELLLADLTGAFASLPVLPLPLIALVLSFCALALLFDAADFSDTFSFLLRFFGDSSLS